MINAWTAGAPAILSRDDAFLKLKKSENDFLEADNLDEIIVQLDTTSTPEVKQVAEKYNVGTPFEYHRIIFPLNGDFASFKNN